MVRDTGVVVCGEGYWSVVVCDEGHWCVVRDTGIHTYIHRYT